MWPFRKKPVKTPLGEAFQDFLRTYVPPPQMPVQNPITVATVCPICLDRIPPGTVSSDHPYCSDCESEAMTIDVVPLGEFLAAKTIEDFDTMLAKWEAVEGFLPSYKAVKAERIVQLRELKRAGC
jgi:hypothetical protein